MILMSLRVCGHQGQDKLNFTLDHSKAVSSFVKNKKKKENSVRESDTNVKICDTVENIMFLIIAIYQ